MFRFVFLLSVLFVSISSFAQSPSYQWALGMGGERSDRGYAITTDEEGHLLTSGYFRHEVDFDPSPGSAEILTAIGVNDIFVHKMSAQGDLQWVRQMGGNGFGYAMQVDQDGNIYLTGSFNESEPMDFNPGTPGGVLTANGEIDVFMLKMDPSGNLLWVKQIGGTGYDYGWDLILDQDGNPVFVGTFENTIDLDPGRDMIEVTSSGGFDFFVVKLDPDGNLLWEDHFGGPGNDVAGAIDIDSESNVLVTGSFSETVDFDPGREVVNMSSAGENDVFLLKLNKDGDLIWVKGMHNDLRSAGLSLVIDQNDDIYTASFFEGIMDFDPSSGVNNLESFDALDCALQKFNPEGGLEWVQHWGGLGNIIAEDMAIDLQGNIQVTGYYQESLARNPQVARNFILSEGSFDMFILGHTADGQLLWATGQGGDNADLSYSIATDNRGGMYTTGYFNGTMDADPGTGSHILRSEGNDDIFVGKWQGITVSVKENRSTDMMLYPNPGRGPFIIELSEPVDGTLSIYDAFGKNVQRLSVQGKEIELDIDLKPGTYWVQIDSKEGSTYTQLIIP